MKASENMMLEALSRLASLHRPLEELLREAPPSGAAAAGTLVQQAAGVLSSGGGETAYRKPVSSVLRCMRCITAPMPNH